VIAIDGFLGSTDDQLQLDAKLNEADLSVLEPFFPITSQKWEEQFQVILKLEDPWHFL
jgi:hypothetical protein